MQAWAQTSNEIMSNRERKLKSGKHFSYSLTHLDYIFIESSIKAKKNCFLFFFV
jgi:hypothetical protein